MFNIVVLKVSIMVTPNITVASAEQKMYMLLEHKLLHLRFVEIVFLNVITLGQERKKYKSTASVLGELWLIISKDCMGTRLLTL